MESNGKLTEIDVVKYCMDVCGHSTKSLENCMVWWTRCISVIMWYGVVIKAKTLDKPIPHPALANTGEHQLFWLRKYKKVTVPNSVLIYSVLWNKLCILKSLLYCYNIIVEQTYYIVGKHIIVLNFILSKVSILEIIHKISIQTVQNPVFICL